MYFEYSPASCNQKKLSHSSKLMQYTLRRCNPSACSLPAIVIPEPISAKLCFLRESQGSQDFTIWVNVFPLLESYRCIFYNYFLSAPSVLDVVTSVFPSFAHNT